MSRSADGAVARRAGPAWWGVGISGVLAGVLLLHPLTMVVYWFEFHPEIVGVSSLGEFVVLRMRAGFEPRMWPMTAIFALMGLFHALGIGWSTRAIAVRQRRVDYLESELARSFPSLIAAGEGEMMELKATARWDLREGRVSRTVEAAIVRAIAGFMNHRGGSLLIGVRDDGTPLGLRNDLLSLRRPDRDGYQQFLIGLVERHVGADACASMHVLFHLVDEHEVCRVVVEPAQAPVYVRDERGAHYFLRTGNSTRELDAREAVAHIAARSGGRR
ncbi:MAG: ATP-binding protein [Gemmatimonadaceae bacterium]|nr:ATP-binding protein [Gemmatimonadaceae bacterium]